MTYLDLIRDADRKLDKGHITLGEYEEMIEPLQREIDHIAESSKKAEGDCISRQAAVDCVTYDVEHTIECLKALPPAQPERKKPVFKTGESVYHVSYADGTGGFKKNKWADWTCPDCGWFVGEQYIPRRHNQQKCNYCAKCGCAIDWSDADMRGEQDGRDD